MNTISAMIVGALLALTPSCLVMTWAALWNPKPSAPPEHPMARDDNKRRGDHQAPAAMLLTVGAMTACSI
jgi:hypothetical protein